MTTRLELRDRKQRDRDPMAHRSTSTRSHSRFYQIWPITRQERTFGKIVASERNGRHLRRVWHDGGRISTSQVPAGAITASLALPALHLRSEAADCWLPCRWCLAVACGRVRCVPDHQVGNKEGKHGEQDQKHGSGLKCSRPGIPLEAAAWHRDHLLCWRNSVRVDGGLLECFFVFLIQIAIEDVSAQTAMPELCVRRARQIFVGGRLGVFVCACLQPRDEL